MNTKRKLAPAQLKAFRALREAVRHSRVVVLQSAAGKGKTEVLRRLHQAAGGAMIGMRQFTKSLEADDPARIEESFSRVLEAALIGRDMVFVDDLQMVRSVVAESRYRRRHLLNAFLKALIERVEEQGKTLVFATTIGSIPAPIYSRGFVVKIEDFDPADYRCVCAAYLGKARIGRIDFGKIYRHAPNLDGHQLRAAAEAVTRKRGAGTEAFIDHLNEHDLISNLELKEVEKVDWADLKGMDDVIAALEAKVALPFENDRVAAELHLKPKRGVLLAGPPGTGKTTIGRALAHRLKSKFFLIDGTMVAGSTDFYSEVEDVFEAAKQNAPSVLFIDDGDVIFGQSGNEGFYRYLLTMLDGLESASAGRVCVMMTAMDVGSLPPAILRSGRIELWLETRLPDEDSRRAILSAKLAALPSPFREADSSIIASASRGLTGADLKAVLEDAKLLYAHDRETKGAVRQVEDYFIDAIDTVRANRRNYFRSKPPQLRETVKVGFHEKQ